MTAPVERAEETSSRLDAIQAASRFFREDPARILIVAGSLRKPDRVIESTVQGLSMGRTIPAGSQIRITLRTQGRYDPGEVIAYVGGPHIIVHRVVRRMRRKTRSYLLTQGDGTWLPDQPISEDRVLGPVSEIHGEHGWTPAGPASTAPSAARLLRWLVIGLFRVHPRAAGAFVLCLHRAVTSFRYRVGLARSTPRGPAPSGIA
jgi:hypothetical protein